MAVLAVDTALPAAFFFGSLCTGFIFFACIVGAILIYRKSKGSAIFYGLAVGATLGLGSFVANYMLIGRSVIAYSRGHELCVMIQSDDDEGVRHRLESGQMPDSCFEELDRPPLAYTKSNGRTKMHDLLQSYGVRE